MTKAKMYEWHEVEGQSKYYDGKILCPICKSSEAVTVLEWDECVAPYCDADCECAHCRAWFKIAFKLEYSESILIGTDEDEQ